MKTIATLTMNPTIDASCEVDRIEHTIKMRTDAERYCPGGGGINVARVFVRLGGNARCIYPSGGATGPALDGLLDQHQLVRTHIPVSGPTRLAMAVFERDTGKEYRFTPAGPTLSEQEWTECLARIADVECDILVASGSLPPGVPKDFYARVSQAMAERGIETALDTSGDALRQGLAGGKFLLVKPNVAELEQAVGRTLSSDAEIADEAQAIVAKGQARFVAVTMGERGAMLASDKGILQLPALPIEAKSAVGAGDSFMAGMIHALARGLEPEEAFRFGMAAGSAAVLTPGTNLAYQADVERIFRSSSG